MLEKLYQVLYDKKLFTQDFAKFKNSWQDEEYKKKVFSVVSDKKLFTQDYETFVNSYVEGKQQGDVAAGAATSSQKDSASNSDLYSSDWIIDPKTERFVENKTPIDQTNKFQLGPTLTEKSPYTDKDKPADPNYNEGSGIGLYYGDPRTYDQQIKDYTEAMDKVLSAEGDWKFLLNKTVEERYKTASKLIKVPVGSPSDISDSYYDYWRQINVDGLKDSKKILEPLFLDKRSLKDDYLKRKPQELIDFKQKIEEGLTEDDLIVEADEVIGDMIHESDYMSKEFLPYFYSKNEELFYNKQLEIISDIEGDFVSDADLLVIEEKMNKFQLDLLEKELKKDKGYNELVASILQVVGEDLNVDIRKFNKSKLLPDWIEGSAILEGIFKTTKAFEFGGVNTEMLHRSKDFANIKNFLKAIESGELNEDQLIALAKATLDEVDIINLYPKESKSLQEAAGRGGASVYLSEEQYKNLWVGEDPTPYLKNKIKEHNKFFLSQISDSQRLQKELDILDSARLFDENGVTFRDIKLMSGEQLPQMVASIVTFGGSTYIQEAGGVYIESLYRIAEHKHGMAFTSASEKEKQQMLFDIIEAGEDDPDTAITVGAANAGLDFASSIFVVTKAAKVVPKQAWRALLRGEVKNAINKSGGKDMAVDALKISTAESITESLQEINSMAGANISTGVYKFDPTRVKEGGAQGFLSSLIFFGLGKGRSLINFTGEQISLKANWSSKDHVLSMIKAEKARVKRDLKEGKITKKEAEEQTSNINDATDVLIDEGLYQVSPKYQKAAIDKANDYVSKKRVLQKKEQDLKEAKENKSSTEEDIKYREEQFEAALNDLADSKYEMQKVQVKDSRAKNKGKAALRVNESTDGPMANKRVFTFRTRKEAAAFVKRYNITVDGFVQDMLDGKANGVALRSGIKYKGKDIIPALIVDQNIEENIQNSSRKKDGSLISAFVESHEITHFILDSIDPKIVSDMVNQLKADLKNSGDLKTSLMLDFINQTQANYKSRGVDQDTLNQEFLTAMSDYLQVQQALDVKSPQADAFYRMGKAINKAVFGATGGEVDFSTPSAVFSFLKNWNKFLNSKGTIKVKGAVEVDEVTGENKSRAQITLEEQKQAIIAEQKALISSKDDAAIAKQMQENIEKIKELNKAIQLERDLADQGKFPTGISQKAKDITRKNKLIVDEAYDPKTSPEVKRQKFKELYDLNRGIIEGTVNKQFNPNIESKLILEDFRQAYNLEFFNILENQYNPSKGSLGAYMNTYLPLRQGNILRELIGPKEMMFTEDATSFVGNKQIGYTPDYGNFTQEEYVQQMVNTIETLGFTPELQNVVKEAVVKILGGRLDISSRSFRTDLSQSLMTMLKSEIQTKVLGSKLKDNFLGMKYPDFMAKHWEDIYAIMPIDAINKRFSIQTKQEKANNVQHPFIYKFTDESGKQTRDTRLEDNTGIGRGKTKKRVVTQEQFLDFFFGENVGGSTQGTRKDTLAEMIAEQAGFDVFSYLLTNDPKVTELFRGRQELFGEIITEDTIDRLQREINRHDGSRNASSRAQIVIDSANYHGLTIEYINKIFDDVKKDDIKDYKSKSLNTFRNDLHRALALDDVVVDVDLYFNTYGSRVSEDFEIRGFNLELGDKNAMITVAEKNGRKNPYQNNFKTKLNLDKGIIIPGEYADGLIDRQGVINISIDMMEDYSWFDKPSVDTKYLGKFFQEEEYIDQDELESNYSAEELRSLLVKKGYDHLTFFDESTETERFIILNKEAISRTSEIGFNAKLDELINPSRAQLSLQETMGNIIEQKTKGKIKSKEQITAAAANVMQKDRSFISKITDTFNYLPYNAEDFIGLTRIFTPAGKDGDIAIRFIEERLLEPYYQGQQQFRTWKQNLNIQYNRFFDRAEYVKKIDSKGMPSLSKQTVEGEITIRAKRSKIAAVEELVKSKSITRAEADAMIADINKFKFKKSSLQQPVNVKGKTFTAEQAVRVYLFYSTGENIDPSLISAEEVKGLVDFIKDPNNVEFLLFASSLRGLVGRTRSESTGDYYVKYNDNIINNTVSHDIYNHAESERKVFFEKFKNNFENIFTNKNMLKLEALYGSNYIRELNSSFRRMYTGKNETTRTANPVETAIMGWTNASVNSIMFLNFKSAGLQLISFANFINWTDNNIISASKTLANPKQFAQDFAMLYNSRYLTNRRGGLQFDIESSAVEKLLRESMAGEKDTFSAFKRFYAQLVKFGYLPTRTADSIAIAFGGATFYRNRLNTYISQGLTETQAIEKTMIDFERLAEESQQSSDPSRISSIQIGPYGRLAFAFMNTPFQYARLSKRAAFDLINGRGDRKTNLSKLTYYTFVQSIFFSAAQNLLNVFDLIPLFKDDDEEEELTPEEKTSYFYALNSWIDGQIKMFGIPGLGATVIKNMQLSDYQDELFRNKEAGGFIKPKRKEENQIIKDLLSFSPPLSSKAQQLSSIDKLKKWNINKQKAAYYGLDDFWYLYPQDPVWEIRARQANVFFNIPLDRLHRKLENISLALDEETKLHTDLLLLMGYSKYVQLPKEKWDLPYPETKTRDFRMFLKKLEREEKKNSKSRAGRKIFQSKQEYLNYLNEKRKK